MGTAGMLSRPVTAIALPAGKARIGHGRQTQPTLASQFEVVFHAELKYIHMYIRHLKYIHMYIRHTYRGILVRRGGLLELFGCSE